MARYDSDTRSRALELYSTPGKGLADAHRETGVPKPTIHRWAQEAGIDSAEITAQKAAQTEAATRAAAAARRAQIEQSKANLLPKLVAIANGAADQQIAILRAARAVQTAAADSAGVVPAELLAKLEAARAGLDERALVGMMTRAIHDMRLMDDESTENVAAGITVLFAGESPAWGSRKSDVIELTPEASSPPSVG